MKKILKFLLSRFFISLILIAIQIYIIFKIFNYSIENPLIAQFFIFISFGVSLWVLFNKHEPEYALSWIMIIMLAPVYGAIFYLIFGKKNLNYVGRKRAEKYVNVYSKYSSRFPHTMKDRSLALKHIDKDFYCMSEYIARSSYSPVWAHTIADYYPLGDDFFPAFKKELRKAKKFIFLEYFTIGKGEMWDGILEILKAKQQQGVEIRILYDDFGSLGRVDGSYDKMLRGMGFKAKAFNPVKPHVNVRMNYRDHRKICVIDGNIGFTGGINLADEYINRSVRFGQWKDSAVLIKGDGVWNLTTCFLSMWALSTGENDTLKQYRPTLTSVSNDGFVQPYSDNPLDDVALAENAYTQVINRATEYVWITTPYLVLDHEITSALCLAAQSGVDVRIMLPGIPDKHIVYEVSKSNYKELILNGVQIYEYVPGFLHSKMFVSDDKVSIIGTINMDYRSFYLHFECGVAFYGSSVIKKVKLDMEDIIMQSNQITEADVRNVSLIRRACRGLLKILSPLM